MREQSFFARHVQDEGGFAQLVGSSTPLSDKQAPFRDNARLFNDRIGALTVDEREKLASFVLLRCFLVVVATPDLDSAYRIFSVITAAGSTSPQATS